jgi:hypothetical protein
MIDWIDEAADEAHAQVVLPLRIELQYQLDRKPQKRSGRRGEKINNDKGN